MRDCRFGAKAPLEESKMKRVFAAFALVACSLLVGSDAFAQTGIVRGKITDDKGQALQDAVLLLEFQGGVTRKHETKTNKKGEYTQVGLQPGPYKITVSKDGFVSEVLPPTRIGLGDPTTLPDIKLRPKGAPGTAAAAGDPAMAEMLGAFKKGVEAFNAGNMEAAEAAYKEVLAKDPTRYEAHHNLGLIYSRKKDLPAAEAAFAKALELKPDYDDAHVSLANAYVAAGQAPKAFEVMTKAAATFPQSGKLQYQVGYLAYNTGKNDEALAALTKAETLDPNNAEIQFYLGMAAVNQNNIPEAAKRLEKYLAMNPTNAQNVTSAKAILPALKPKS
jgi:Tfp pilus assembly protein PilF